MHPYCCLLRWSTSETDMIHPLGPALPRVTGVAGLQARAAACGLTNSLSSDSSKGNLMEVLALSAIVDKFHGELLATFITKLHPSLEGTLPAWCYQHRLPSSCIVGTLEDLCPGGTAYFFQNPREFVQRGLLPDSTMGPGEHRGPA